MEEVLYIILGILGLAVIVITVAGTWKAFQKAGKPGWAAIVPFYVWVIKLEMAGKPVWWIVFLLIPFVNYVGQIVVPILWSIEIAKKFGKSTGFAIGMVFLPFVFWPMLGFGDAEWQYNPGGMELEV